MAILSLKHLTKIMYIALTNQAVRLVAAIVLRIITGTTIHSHDDPLRFATMLGRHPSEGHKGSRHFL
jgi:hypothetical protein